MMKKLVIILFILAIAGCKLRPDRSAISTAAIHFSGVFITDNVPSTPDLRIKGQTIVKNEGDSIYSISGTVEGFSPLNYPVSIEHFTEKLHYTGGEPNDSTSWVCMEIYIGRKKIK